MNFSEIFPSLFQDGKIVPYDKIQSNINSLRAYSSAAKLPDVLRDRAGILTISNNLQSAINNSSVINGLIDYVDYHEEFEDESCAERLLSIYRTIMIGQDTPPVDDIDVSASIGTDEKGNALFLRYIASVSGGTHTERVIIGQDCDEYGVLDDSSDSSNVELNVTLDSSNQIVSSDIDDRSTIDLESLSDVVTSRETTATKMMDLVQAASNGNLSLTQVNSIIGESNQPGLQRIKQRFAMYPSLPFRQALYLLLTEINGATGTPTESGYTPYSTPEFCVDVLSLAWNAMSTAIISIIGMVFFCFSRVLGLVATLVSTLVSFFNQNVVQTEAKINGVYDSPVWNIPLTGTLSIRDIGYTVTIDPWLRELLKEYGYCTVPINGGSADFSIDGPTYGYIVFFASGDPSDDENIFVQVLISAQACTTNRGRFGRLVPYTFQLITNGIQLVQETYLGTLVSEIRDSRDDDDLGYAYAVTDNTSLRRALTVCIGGIFSALGYSSSADLPYGASVTYTPEGQLNLLELAHAICTGSASIEYTSQDPTIPTAISEAYYLLAACFDIPNSVIAANPLSYESLYGFLSAVASDDNFKSLIRLGIASYLGRIGASIDPQLHLITSDILSPAIDFPSTSASALKSAVMITTLTTSAVLLSGLVSKRYLGAWATKRLASREQKFEEAKTEYLSNPSYSNAMRLYSANRKLTRAWRIAGYTGISAYNGFSTGSGNINTSAGGQTYDMIGSILESTTNAATSESSLDSIAKLIRG